MHSSRIMIYKKEGRSLFRFAAVGCINTLVDFTVFTILKSIFDINYLVCQVAGYSAGVLNSFVMNKVWTFESKTSKFHTSMQFARFIAVNLISLGVSLAGLKILIGYGNINVYISKIIVTGLAQAVNYLGYRFWVFCGDAKSQRLGPPQ